VLEEKTDLLHAIYDRIVVAGKRIVGLPPRLRVVGDVGCPR
jgi:hypothetical protein